MLSAEEALPIIFQTLDALDYAHHAKIRVKLASGELVEAEGVVHRDVKPSNIFLCASGASCISKLGDFGLAKAFATAGLSGISAHGAIGGSPQFMPQQLLNDFKMATPEVDVWSAAASLYYMLTGQPPREFAGEPPERWLWVLEKRVPIPIRQRNAAVPAALAEVIDYALDDKEGLHFPSAAALKQALESVL
jgi:serine/threonine protein kinase